MTLLGDAARATATYVGTVLGTTPSPQITSQVPHDPEAAPQFIVLYLPCPGGIDHLAEWTCFAGIYTGSANQIKCEVCDFK